MIKMNILRELNPKKLDLYDYSEFHIIVTEKIINFQFMTIHQQITW